MWWSQFKHVYPGRDGWVTVRVRKGEELHYVGSFRSTEPDVAKKELAKFLKVPVAMLPRKEKRSVVVRKKARRKRVARHRHVYYNDAGVIFAIAGKTYLGTFETEVAAAAAVAQHLTCTVKALVKKAARRERASNALVRFQVLKSVFSEWLPNDLVSSCQLGKELVARQLVVAPGPLWMYFILAKETSFRRAILSGWAALGGGRQVGLGNVAESTMHGTPETIDAAYDIYSVLRDAAGKLNGEIQEHVYWARHVHVGVNYHAGWLPLLLRLRILGKVRGRKRIWTKRRRGKSGRAVVGR